MRIEHKPWRLIAEECGFNDQGHAYNAVMRYLDTIPKENIQEFIREEVIRLEALREKLAPGLPEAKHVDAFMKVTDRIHRLMGINDKLEIKGAGPKGEHLIRQDVTIKGEIDLGVLSEDELRSYRSLLEKLTGRNRDAANSSGSATPPVIAN